MRQLLPIIAASEGKDAVDAVTATLPLRPPKPEAMNHESYERAITQRHLADIILPQDDFANALRARRDALDLVQRDAQDARRLGFAAKWILHPDQIAPIQEAWVPTRERALQALQLAASYAKSAVDGSGAELHGNQMADKAVVAADWALVEAALRAQVLTPDDIAQKG